MEKTGCKIICGAPTTLAVKGLMMMMMTTTMMIMMMTTTTMTTTTTMMMNAHLAVGLVGSRLMEHLWEESSWVGLLTGSTRAGTYVSILEWGTWSWSFCPPKKTNNNDNNNNNNKQTKKQKTKKNNKQTNPLQLRFLGSSKPAAEFTSTGPSLILYVMILYVMQTLSDVFLDCRL